MKQIGVDSQSNPSDRMTDYLKKSVAYSLELAKKRGTNEISLQDLFLSLISDSKNIASKILEKIGVDLNETREELMKKYTSEPLPISPTASERYRNAISNAYLISSEFGHVYVGTEHVLISMLEFTDEDFVKDLNKASIDADSVKKVLFSYATYQPGLFSQSSENEEIDQNTSSSNQDSSKPDKSSLDFFAREMNVLAKSKKYMKVWGRDDEVERVIHILSRRTKNNPILVGEAGVGKTAVVEGLTQRIVGKMVPKSFQKKKIIQLDLASIIAGSKIRGDVEERILAIVDEVSDDPDKILFIDEIHMIVGAGSAGQGSMDIANILKPHLTTGDMRVIGATTYDEYQKFFESDNALSRRFQPVRVEELNGKDAIEILKSIKEEFETYHGVRIDDEALEESVALAERYITDRYFPDKAIDIIDEASAKIGLRKDKQGKSKEDFREMLEEIQDQKNDALESGNISLASKLLNEERKLLKKINRLKNPKNIRKNSKYRVKVEDVRSVVSDWTKIPVNSMTNQDIRSLKNLSSNIQKKIFGQDNAIDDIAASLKRARVGIGDPKKPQSVFLFLGPTGVGKTELAKQLTIELFGTDDSLIQVDMSEFMEQHSVAKLIGSPPGYIGYQEGGQLTEKVRRKPHSIILLDEIEKAHPDLLNILLQVMEEGQLTDAKGRKVNFRNTIIIMTSNIGASDITQDSVLGFDLSSKSKNSEKEEEMLDEAYENMKERLTEELKDTLMPEFLNRIDSVVIFKTLTEKDAYEIAKMLVDDLNTRLETKNVEIEATTAVLKYIAQEGYDEKYGARNIKRKVQELIENKLAEIMLDQKIVDNKKLRKIKVSKKNDELIFEVV